MLHKHIHKHTYALFYQHKYTFNQCQVAQYIHITAYISKITPMQLVEFIYVTGWGKFHCILTTSEKKSEPQCPSVALYSSRSGKETTCCFTWSARVRISVFGWKSILIYSFVCRVGTSKHIRCPSIVWKSGNTFWTKVFRVFVNTNTYVCVLLCQSAETLTRLTCIQQRCTEWKPPLASFAASAATRKHTVK